MSNNARRFWPALETKETPDPVAELKAAFDGYHGEVKTIAEKIGGLQKSLDDERKEREALEMRINRQGFGTRSAKEVDAEELRQAGEAFRVYIKDGNKSALMDLKGMSVGSDPEGGFLSIPSMSTAMTHRIFESSPLRKYARIVEIGTGEFEEIVDIDDAEAGWVGEKQSRPDTAAPDLGKFKIPVREIYAQPKVTQQLLDDAFIDVGGWLVDKVSSIFLRKETTAFYGGNGILQPRGFLTYDTTAEIDSVRAWGKLQHIVTGSASDLPNTGAGVYDKLVDVQTSLKSGHRANAIWQMNRRTAGRLMKMKDDQENPIWQRSVTAGQPDMLLGHAVELAEDMPDIAADAFPIAFGDFKSGYTIVDRLGERLLRDPYTDKPNVKFYMHRRVGGDVANFEAIKFLKVAAA